MSGATSPRKWTYEDYARLPDDGKRYEVLDGEVLSTPSPSANHQRIAARLFYAFARVCLRSPAQRTHVQLERRSERVRLPDCAAHLDVRTSSREIGKIVKMR